MKIKELNTETSYVIDPVAPRMGAEQAEILKTKYLASPRGRHRLCFHQNPAVDLHDIVICYDRRSYIPPNKHVGKVESLLVLSGELDFYLFNDLGEVYDYRRLSTPDSGLPFYLRVPPNTWHGLRAIGTDPCIIKETIAGPYDPSTLRWADFAPSEQDGSDCGFDWYDAVARKCKAQKTVPLAPEQIEQVSSTVFRSSRQLVTVDKSQLVPLFEAAHTSSLKRARLCCHTGPEEKLQEMFIVLAREVDIEESMHLRKDESLTVISGAGNYIFPNEDGTVRDHARLASFDQARNKLDNFFVRINRYLPHKITVDSDFLLIHEATTGPFLKSDTDYRLEIVGS